MAADGIAVITSVGDERSSSDVNLTCGCILACADACASPFTPGFHETIDDFKIAAIIVISAFPRADTGRIHSCIGLHRTSENMHNAAGNAVTATDTGAPVASGGGDSASTDIYSSIPLMIISTILSETDSCSLSATGRVHRASIYIEVSTIRAFVATAYTGTATICIQERTVTALGCHCASIDIYVTKLITPT